MTPGWAHWLVRTVSFPDYRFTFPQVCVFVTVCSSAQQHFTALHLQSCSRMSIIPPICSTIIKLVSNTLNYSNWLQTAPRRTFLSDLRSFFKKIRLQIQFSLFKDKNQKNMGAGQTLAEVCTFQRRSLTSWLHAHSRRPWSCSPSRPSGLQPPGRAQPCGPALCPEREASSSPPLPSASAAGWGLTTVDALSGFPLCWWKGPPRPPDWCHRCPQCEVQETGPVAAGPPRRLLPAPLDLPWQRWSEEVVLADRSTLPTHVRHVLLQRCCLH